MIRTVFVARNCKSLTFPTCALEPHVYFTVDALHVHVADTKQMSDGPPLGVDVLPAPSGLDLVLSNHKICPRTSEEYMYTLKTSRRA